MYACGFRLTGSVGSTVSRRRRFQSDVPPNTIRSLAGSTARASSSTRGHGIGSCSFRSSSIVPGKAALGTSGGGAERSGTRWLVPRKRARASSTAVVFRTRPRAVVARSSRSSWKTAHPVSRSICTSISTRSTRSRAHSSSAESEFSGCAPLQLHRWTLSSTIRPVEVRDRESGCGASIRGLWRAARVGVTPGSARRSGAIAKNERGGGARPPPRNACANLLPDDLVRADGLLEIRGVLLCGVVRARVPVRDPARGLLDRRRDLAEVGVRRQEPRLLEGLRRIDEILLRLELRYVRRVASRDRVRVFDVDLRDGVFVVPGLDELPSEVFVLRLSRDVPACAESTDRERRSAVLGRVQQIADVLLCARLIL